MTATGLRAMLGVQWRTHRRGTLVWVLALIAMMVGTAGSIAGLYNTPEKIHTYAQAATTGEALVAVNGRVEGIDSLGGIIADEFGFLAAFLLPLLGISLVALRHVSLKFDSLEYRSLEYRAPEYGAPYS